MNQETKNPGVAAVLSFLFNGLGQLYNGQIFKGLVLIFLSFLNILFSVLGAILIGFWLLGKKIFPFQLLLGLWLFFLGLFFIALLGIYSIFDAYRGSLKKF